MDTTNPSKLNKIIPGIKKLLKGELSNIERGIPNILPEGEIINTPPPKIAPNPRNNNKKSSEFLVVFIFIMFYFLLVSLYKWHTTLAAWQVRESCLANLSRYTEIDVGNELRILPKPFLAITHVTHIFFVNQSLRFFDIISPDRNQLHYPIRLNQNSFSPF